MPLTAEAWNEIVDALKAVNGYLITSEASSVRVEVGTPQLDVPGARIAFDPGPSRRR